MQTHKIRLVSGLQLEIIENGTDLVLNFKPSNQISRFGHYARLELLEFGSGQPIEGSRDGGILLRAANVSAEPPRKQ